MSPDGGSSAAFNATRMRNRYVVALALIALLTLLSQAIIQITLADQEYDSRVVNIAGRQRMLSQRITKDSLYLRTAVTDDERRAAVDELKTSLDLWQRSHTGLRSGDETLGLPGANSREIDALFRDIEPDYTAMVAAAGAIIAAPDRADTVAEAADRLRAHEPAFLAGMNQIVFAYDSEAKHKVDHARYVELAIATLTLITLLLEARLIFAPAVRRMRHDMRRHELHEADLDRLFSANPTAMFLVDADTLNVLRGNQRADALMGDPAGGYLSRPLQDMLDGRFDANQSFLEKVRDGNALNEYEIVLLDSRRSVIEALASACHINFGGRRNLVVAVANISEVKKAQQTLQYYATFDEMTGLVNRRTGMLMLSTAMNHARRDARPLSVCYADLDGLKAVNDRYGHHEGDWMIQSLAAALLRSIRDGDVAIRLGGDEFLLVLHDCPQDHSALLLNRIRAQLAQGADEKADRYRLSVSLGFAHYDPDRHATPDDLVDEADRRMYEAKHAREARPQQPVPGA